MPQAPHAKQVFIICGATATGKTALAIKAASWLHTEIISCDSRQCYRETTIGVAKPSPDELKLVPHHFINSHSIHEEVNAAIFEEYALKVTNDLLQTHNSVVMVGGTGLYIKAFTQGIDLIPAIDSSIRHNIIEGYKANGIGWLQQLVEREDAEYYQTGENKNPQRLMRALEVIRGTGKSIRTFQTGIATARNFEVRKVAIDVEREELIRRIDLRVDQMMDAGLLEEAEGLYQWRHLPALKTVGYSEIFQYMDGAISLADAVEQIKIHTRQYAKRQLTWFRKDKQITWMKADQFHAFLETHFPNA